MNRLSPLMLTLLVGCATAPDQPSTAYEGARVIVGDGRVIDNATLVVQGDKLVQVGPSGEVRVPAGATRVSAAGKTIMPMPVSYTHLTLPTILLV